MTNPEVEAAIAKMVELSEQLDQWKRKHPPTGNWSPLVLEVWDQGLAHPIYDEMMGRGPRTSNTFTMQIPYVIEEPGVGFQFFSRKPPEAMTNPMIERVARGIEIAATEKLAHHPASKFITKLGWLWPILARAAIEAMREPTEAMREAACDKICLSGYQIDDIVAGLGFTAAIDAALAEQPE